MKNEQLYQSLLERFLAELRILEDKPEETASSTLKALWFAASGEPKSAQAAESQPLPELSEAQIEDLESLVERRLSGEPLAHITGRQQFMGIELLASPEALVPRKETELLAKKAIQYLNNITADRKSLKVIDVCTGAGNLAVAYAVNEPRAEVYAADLSREAVSLAKKNAKYLELEEQVTLVESDLLDAYESEEFYNQVDLLSCNPPYISSNKVEVMDEEISQHEPSLAFDGGPFGIKILQRLIADSPRFLREGGCLMFEVGLGQGELIIKRIEKTGLYKQILPVKDKNNDIRAIVACV